jgi:hypothetical protein
MTVFGHATRPKQQFVVRACAKIVSAMNSLDRETLKE